jgi:hypothetical protein
MVKTKIRFSPKIYDFDVNSVMIADLTNKNATINLIKRQIRSTAAWRAKATALVDSDKIVGNVAKDVGRLLQLARSTVTGPDTVEYQKYRRAVEKRILTLVNPDKSRLKRAYQDVVDLTKDSSQKQFDNAVKYAIKEKARSNAERIVVTETNRAYNRGVILDANSDKDVAALQWVLSPDHPKYDECNFLAEYDGGNGPGVYRKDELPECPAHPNCLCRYEQVYTAELKGDAEKFFQSDAEKKYNHLPEGKRKLVNKNALSGVKY